MPFGHSHVHSFSLVLLEGPSFARICMLRSGLFCGQVHWFSIANSLLIVLFLTGMIAMILIRNLCRDITRYNRVPTEEERAEERCVSQF